MIVMIKFVLIPGYLLETDPEAPGTLEPQDEHSMDVVPAIDIPIGTFHIHIHEYLIQLVFYLGIAYKWYAFH